MKLSRLKKLTWKLLGVYTLGVVLVAAADPAPGKWKQGDFWVAMALLGGCIGLRLWAAGHLVKNKVLTVTGPYAYVKNPLYIGTLLGMTGAAFLAWGPPGTPWYHRHFNWLAFGASLAIFVGYYIPYKKRREGGRLQEIFGEAWDHYDRSVPDYLPRWSRYERAVDRPWSWAAAYRNSELWTPPAVAAGVAALLWNGWILKWAARLLH